MLSFVTSCPCLATSRICGAVSRRSAARRRPRPRCRPHAVVCAVAPASDYDYSDWSADFLELCRTQLDLLSVTIGDVSQVVLFFRRENRASGALEFVPLAVKDVERRKSGDLNINNTRRNDSGGERVWIASENGLEIPTRRSTRLPGGVPAATILPSYPAMASEDCVLPDGGLCVPVKYNDAVAGSIVLWKKQNTNSNNGNSNTIWKSSEVNTAKVVARTISIAATMEGKSLFIGADSTASSLGTITHQMRSPITALVAFGHVLLRKLPPGHRLRQLAKSIVVEALRLDELLAPLDTLTDKLSLAAQTDERRRENMNRRLDADNNINIDNDTATAGMVDVDTDTDAETEEERVLSNYDRLYGPNSAQTSRYSDLVPTRMKTGNRSADDDEARSQSRRIGLDDMEMEIEIDMEICDDDDEDIFFCDDEDIFDGDDDVCDEAALREVWEGVLAEGDWISPSYHNNMNRATWEFEKSDGEVVWLCDISRPIVNTVRLLAEERGLNFSVLIDRDAPAARVCSACDVRESIYNLLNNALAYTPPGGSIGIVVIACQVLVWDTGPGVGEEDATGLIWEFGRRRVTEDTENVEGKGIGLAVAKMTAEKSNGSVAVISPLPLQVDPRVVDSGDGDGDNSNSNNDGTSRGCVFCLTFPRATAP